MPNIATSPDMHSLELSLYFAPNSRQVVYVEPQSHSHLWPLPTAIAATATAAATVISLLLPGASCPPLSPPPQFSQLFVDCCLPPLLPLLQPLPSTVSASAVATGSVVGIATASPLPVVVVMIAIVVTVAVIPVAIVNNDPIPDLRRSLRHRSSPSLLFRCFLSLHCHCLRLHTAAASSINVVSLFPRLLPLSVSPSPASCCFCRQCGRSFRGCCRLLSAMVMTCSSTKV